MRKIKFGRRRVGDGEPVLTIAEISCNHLQKKDHALRLIEEAKSAGADSVKFQTYTPDTITLDARNKYFQMEGTLWEGKYLHDLYKEACTPWGWFPELKDRAESAGLVFFSSAFDETAVDFLEKLGVPVHKIASFEIDHIPLIKYAASKKKPMVISTGLAELKDIELAVKTVRGQGNDDIILFKCTSAYPAPFNEMNLAAIPDLAKRFDAVPGLSDHSTGTTAAVAAVALGARLIEKHFILDRKHGGPDAAFSLEPAEFRRLVESVREAEQAVGEPRYELGPNTKKHRFLMRSIFVARNIRKGERFTRDNLRVVRPGYGLHPQYYEGILGKAATRDLEKGTPLDWKMVEGGKG